MSSGDFERLLSAWLADGPEAVPRDVVERALAQARTTPQARTMRLPWARLPSPTLPQPRALATVMASIATIALVAVAGLWGLQNRSIPPAITPVPPIASATPPGQSPSPEQSASHEQSPTEAPSTDPTDEPARGVGFSWEQVGHIDGEIVGLAGVEAGYVAFGRAQDEDDEYAAAWFSSDGEKWQASALAVPVAPCPGWPVQPDSWLWSGASNGSSVVLVGRAYEVDPDQCGSTRAVAWVATDGQDWQRSEAFGEGQDLQAVHVWAVPGGWESIVSGSPEAPSTLWRSADGISWEQLAVLAEAGSGTIVGPARSDAGGQRLLAVHDRESAEVRLSTSRDGLEWQTQTAFEAPDGDAQVQEIVASPSSGSAAWLVVMDAWPAVTTWSSPDLENWQEAQFPVPYLDSVAATRFGLLAAGIDECFYTGGECPPDDLLYEALMFLSADGLEWASIEAIGNSSIRPQAIADGPAGVIAAGGGFGSGSQVWRLSARAE
jgi:hypothetical protein